MIRLTPYEQEMLDGKYGAAKQVALQKIIDYARILGRPTSPMGIWTAPIFWPWATTTGRPS